MADQKWWQSAVFYQIYPRSFADANGDGIGDLKGMTEKLDYLKKLGVDALWLSPHYPSPNWDCGYDISDYENVAPEYGTLDDFQKFLDEAHGRKMHVILDLVLNHTSDEHAWFKESKSSRDNPKADWYVWVDPLPVDGKSGIINPPNNWQSCFDGPAWTYVPERGQFYYHYFMKQQPDLNWHNPEVKQAMWRAVRFWLEMGVDGFRLDAIGTIYEDANLTPHSTPLDLARLRHFSDSAQTEEEKKLAGKLWHDMFKNQWGGSGLHDLMKELRTIVDEYPGDRMLVGEDDDIRYMGNGDDELHLVFNFPLMRTNHISPAHIRNNQTDRLGQLDALKVRGWACNTLGNHDSARIINRYGYGIHNDQLARLHLAVLMTMRGTPFIYNGEEIGMSDLVISEPSKLRDTMASWYFENLTLNLGVEQELAAQRAGAMSRDKNRTPMQWRNSPNGGFCPENITPWLPINPNYTEGINVEEQEKDPASLLGFYRQMIGIRRSTPALVEGEYIPIHETSKEYLAFLRTTPKQKVLVVLNFHEKEVNICFEDLPDDIERVIYKSSSQKSKTRKNLNIDPFGIFIGELP